MRFPHARWWIAGAALLGLVFAGIRLDHHLHRQHLLHAGDSLVPLALTSLAGTPVTLQASGRPQVINVFATWCVPCNMEMPAFEATARGLQARGVVVSGIDQDEGSAQVALFAHRFSLSFPIYIDRDKVTHDVLGARMIPYTVYIDANGIIRWQHAGPLSAQDLIDLALLVHTASRNAHDILDRSYSLNSVGGKLEGTR